MTVKRSAKAVAVAMTLSLVISGTSFVAPQPARAELPADVMARCQPLISAAKGALSNRKAKSAAEATGITAGSSLSEAACVDSLFDISFDSFMLVPSISSIIGGAFEQLKKQFINAIRNAVCDFGNNLKEETDKFLTCTANVSVSLSGGGGLGSFDAESCLGTGIDGFEYNMDKVIGNSSGGGITWDQSVDFGTMGEDGEFSAGSVLENIQSELEAMRNPESGGPGT
ncbi:hypothetical protein [Marinobacterium stanieri]|uniref:Uncharacterized protein n=1 Tax=Marinobacterium stanieri TaxID=49186 RepID=A0A1N6X959_9GAMM|nr:hypothetical protein [Marinobacterium stanieri]SIQ98771.1 hypothetical protein SAMN05421647_11321 [Marinobacterium stanieri]